MGYCMRRYLLLIAMLALCGGVSAAGEATFRDAMALFRARNFEDAKAAFVEVAESTEQPERKGEALEMAVRSAIQQQEYDDAMALAERIPDDSLSKLNRMEVLARQRKWSELVEAFEDEALDDWPTARAAQASHLRGQAHAGLRDADRAVRDLRRAVEVSPGNPYYWHTLAGVYRDLVRDPDEAAVAFGRAFEEAGKSGNWLPVSATIEEARIRLRQVRPDDALAVLERYDEEDVASLGTHWRRSMLRAYGRVYAAQGRDREALDKFEEANSLE